MPKVALYNIEGKEIGEIELKDEIFAVEVSSAALHMTVKNYLANQRQGTQSTKTRTEVSGGGAKPWKQKGTGRARQGSIRAPQWKGGGVALGPKPRDYSYTLNKKTRRLALKSALSSKVLENNIVVVDKLAMDEIKTKSFVKILENLKVDTKAFVVTGAKETNLVASAKNVPGVKTAVVDTINTYDVLNHTKLVIEASAVTKLEEVYL
ncbi:MAG: 50S ribosomal protein L4 [Clostridia bacterium]|nr:50S ribosomal protein L4 [Clostridia bacterium]